MRMSEEPRLISRVTLPSATGKDRHGIWPFDVGSLRLWVDSRVGTNSSSKRSAQVIGNICNLFRVFRTDHKLPEVVRKYHDWLVCHPRRPRELTTGLWSTS